MRKQAIRNLHVRKNEARATARRLLKELAAKDAAVERAIEACAEAGVDWANFKGITAEGFRNAVIAAGRRAAKGETT